MTAAAGERRSSLLLRKWQQLGAMLTDPGLARSDVLVGQCLLDAVDSSKGFAWPSQRTVAERTGLGRRSVRRAIDRLEVAGWFVVERLGRGRGRSDRYTPSWEKGAQARHFDDAEKGAPERHFEEEKGAPVRPLAADKRAHSVSQKGAPLRPDSSYRRREGSMRESARESRGTRLPLDMTFPAEWEAWATEEGYADPRTEWKIFRDYWVNEKKNDPKGIKADWFATWRNWIRRELKGSPRNGNRTATTRDKPSAHRTLFEAGAQVADRGCD